MLSHKVKFQVNSIGLALLGTSLFAAVSAQTVTQSEMEDKDTAKNANIAVAQKLNGTSPQQQQNAKDTANAVNQIPGVKITPQDLQPPTQPPIKGFHPIKRMLQPIENLEGMSIKLEQQIMKLEGPIASLQPPMLGLQKKMVSVDGNIGKMQTQLDGMQTQVQGVRFDIAGMRKDINALREPIVALRDPIGSVAQPLEALRTQLNLVLLAILFTAVIIAVGTPVAAIFIYKYHDKLFPSLSEQDMPKLEPKKRTLG